MGMDIQKKKMKQALIDLGSNSIRLTVYSIHDQTFTILFKEKIMAGLAGYVDEGRLNEEGIQCAIDALKNFQNIVSLLEISKLSVFATASLRNITNTEEALAAIEKATSLHVDVISGEKEAQLGYIGVTHDIQAKEGIVVDIGGASTELVHFKDTAIINACSIQLGSLKLYKECVRSILPGKGSMKRIHSTVRSYFSNTDMTEVQCMICTGGTARATLHLCRKMFHLPDSQHTFTFHQLNELLQTFHDNTEITSEFLLKFEPSRIHTIIPGMMILHYLMKHYNIQECTVSEYGVREGYLLEEIIKASH